MDKYIIKGLIEKLKDNTTTSDISWNRFAANIDVYDPDNSLIMDFILRLEGLVLYSNIYNEKLAKTDLKNSYYADYRGGRIFLFCVWSEEGFRSIVMALQGRMDANLFLVDEADALGQVLDLSYEIQTELNELFAAIIEQVDSPQDFIGRILD